MEFISVREAAEQWGISQALVRKYCYQQRIPGTIFENGRWKIPEDARKPDKIANVRTLPEMPPLAAKLNRQKTKKGFHGLYDYVQIELTYSSCRMASSRLTQNQVETIFRKGKVKESFEPLKVSDLVETMNHCVCVDYIMEHANAPLTQKMIMQLHYMLMFGTVDQRRKRVKPGVYRNKRSPDRNRILPPSDQVRALLKELIQAYESKEEIGRTDILDFHVKFERIFPFEDGNGRIGRLIMFKECLRHDVMPFIIDDKHRSQYLKGIAQWDLDRMTLLQLVDAAQERFAAKVDLFKLGEYRYPNYGNKDEGEYHDEDD